MLGHPLTSASPRAEPCSGLQPPAQGQGSRGGSLRCPYLLGSAGKCRESWRYILQTPTLPPPNQGS